MKALTVTPGVADSVRLEDVEDATAAPGELLVEGISIGVCGTDREIVAGKYGRPSPGRHRLVIGHEPLGRVVEAPARSGFAAGDCVVGFVRRPDPVPCPACAVGEWDMCSNGLYTEHGIKGLDGFASERYAIPADAAIKVPASLEHLGVLIEPASIIAKAWDHIDRIGARAAWSPRRVLVTGAGPVGVLAALFSAQRGYDVHVLDRVADGPKPGVVRDLDASYHNGPATDACPDADIVIECTGVGHLVFDILTTTAPAVIICLTVVSTGGRTLTVNPTTLNREIVLANNVVFGSVNARHYESAATALAQADPSWLRRLITRTVPLTDWPAAFERRDHDVKVVINLNP